MPRYIDAEGLNLYDDLFMKGKNDSGVWVRYRDVERLIRNAPTADVEEVRHGKWQVAGMFDDFAKCSLCGAMYPCLNADGKPFNYCPDCGAKMNRKENEDV